MERRISGYEQFCRLSVQLNSALKTRGGPILQSANAEISVKQFETLMTWEVSERLKVLSALLRMAYREKEPLSLTTARCLYSGCLQDTLCSVLARVQWRQFCTQVSIAGRLDVPPRVERLEDAVQGAVSQHTAAPLGRNSVRLPSRMSLAGASLWQKTGAHLLGCIGPVNWLCRAQVPEHGSVRPPDCARAG